MQVKNLFKLIQNTVEAKDAMLLANFLASGPYQAMTEYLNASDKLNERNIFSAQDFHCFFEVVYRLSSGLKRLPPDYSSVLVPIFGHVLNAILIQANLMLKKYRAPCVTVAELNRLIKYNLFTHMNWKEIYNSTTPQQTALDLIARAIDGLQINPSVSTFFSSEDSEDLPKSPNRRGHNVRFDFSPSTIVSITEEDLLSPTPFSSGDSSLESTTDSVACIS